MCASLTLCNSRTFLSRKRNTSSISSHSPFPSSLNFLISIDLFLSLRICLLWALHINGDRHYVALCICFLSLSKVFSRYSCWSIYEDFIPSRGWMILHCTYMLHFIYLLSDWWNPTNFSVSSCHNSRVECSFRDLGHENPRFTSWGNKSTILILRKTFRRQPRLHSSFVLDLRIPHWGASFLLFYLLFEHVLTMMERERGGCGRQLQQLKKGSLSCNWLFLFLFQCLCHKFEVTVSTTSKRLQGRIFHLLLVVSHENALHICICSEFMSI